MERSAKIARRLARILSRPKKLLESIENGDAHPVMAAYGLLKNEDDLTGLEETVKNRQRPSSRLVWPNLIFPTLMIDLEFVSPKMGKKGFFCISHEKVG